MSEYTQFSIRLKETDKDKLEFIAEENSRTLTKQIEQILIKYYNLKEE